MSTDWPLCCVWGRGLPGIVSGVCVTRPVIHGRDSATQSSVTLKLIVHCLGSSWNRFVRVIRQLFVSLERIAHCLCCTAAWKMASFNIGSRHDYHVGGKHSLTPARHAASVSPHLKGHISALRHTFDNSFAGVACHSWSSLMTLVVLWLFVSTIMLIKNT